LTPSLPGIFAAIAALHLLLWQVSHFQLHHRIFCCPAAAAGLSGDILKKFLDGIIIQFYISSRFAPA
jgi:hypothetical protein